MAGLPARGALAAALVASCAALGLQKPGEVSKHEPAASLVEKHNTSLAEKHTTFTWGFVDGPSAVEAEDIVASIAPGGVWMATSPQLRNRSSQLALTSYRSKYGFYLHTFADAAACIHLLREVRRLYPKEPIYIMSDGGQNFSGICERVGNCEFEWKPPANDRWNPVPFFLRFQAAARRLNSKFVVMLEPDNELRQRIRATPDRDAGGLNDQNPAFHEKMVQYIERKGQEFSGNKDYHVAWRRFGLAGGSYFSTAAVLDAFNPDDVDWRMLRTLDSKRMYSSDVAMPLALACHGYTYYPWSEVTQQRYGLADGAALRHYGREEVKPHYGEQLSQVDLGLVTSRVPSHISVICQGCMWDRDDACYKRNPIQCPTTGQDGGPPAWWQPNDIGRD